MSFQKNVQKLVTLYPIIENVQEERVEALYIDGHRAKTFNPKFPFKNWFLNILHLDPTGQWILRAMQDNWPEIDQYKIKALDTILEKGNAKYIFYAGLNEPGHFNFEKGMQALFSKKDEDGWWIYLAGTHWKKFDYKKGLDAIITQDEVGEAIYKAGLQWKRFDYRKALDALKEIKKVSTSRYSYSAPYYDDALEHWPKGAAEVIQQSQEIKRSAKKMPKTPFKLKESTLTPVDDDYIIKAFASKNFFPMHSQNLKIVLLRNGWSLWQGKMLIAYAPKDSPTHLYLNDNYKNPFKQQLMKHSKFSMHWINSQAFIMRKAEESDISEGSSDVEIISNYRDFPDAPVQLKLRIKDSLYLYKDVGSDDVDYLRWQIRKGMGFKALNRFKKKGYEYKKL
jgi:hypothetical protein